MYPLIHRIRGMKEMEVDVAVIGGGVVGLAIARELSGTGREVIVF